MSAGRLTTLMAAAAAAMTVNLAAQGAAQQAGAPPAQGRAGAPAQPQVEVPWNDAIPAGTAAHAAKALAESSRHGEWVDIALPDGTRLNSFVVYPERKDKAGVVLVIHDINGMRDIPRAVGDQLAQDGFIAIVPDFLSGKGPDGGGSASLGTGVGQAIRALTDEEMTARLNAAMEYGKKLPASNGKTAVIGFCWGGTRVWAYAMAQPALNGAVVYYGSAPGATAETADETLIGKIKAPVIGMFGGNDARINTTLPPTEAAMKKLGKGYEQHIFDGAGHGFLGNQAGAAGANLKASEQAWPLTISFLQKNLK
jgi:carboxymethylenebutenolidase